MDKTISDLQLQVDEWIKGTKKGYFSELTNLGVLMEEVGELSKLMVRKYGDQVAKPTEENKEIADELADILWVTIALANQMKIDLKEALKLNFEKKLNRDKNRFN